MPSSLVTDACGRCSVWAKIEDQQQIGGVGAGGLVRMQFSVDERTNSIIAAGTRQDLAVVEAILLRLDEGDVRERTNVVYRLNNASAQAVSETLNALAADAADGGDRRPRSRSARSSRSSGK